MLKTEYSPLLETFKFKSGIELKNRVVMAPMTNFSSNEDGTVSRPELDYYIRRSGGAGMVITACVYVSRGGKGFPGEFGADHDGLIPSLRELAEAIKGEGAKAVLQIFHGGRQCPPEQLVDGQPVSASDVPAELPGGGHGTVPRPLTDEEITGIIADFGEATRRAIEAGFDGVEIHGANGYLLQQFFSPHSNRREDRWGGDLQKRLTFPLAVLRSVKAAVKQHAQGGFLVGYRFSPEEPETPGITMADTFALIDALTAEGLDYLHASLMELWSLPRRGTEDSRPRIEQIVDRAGDKAPVIGVGSLYSAADALKSLDSGISLVALGRPLLIEPDWVQKLAGGRADEIKTELDPNAQAELVIPDPLWRALIHTPGWLPVKK
ncbi:MULTISPECIES: NADH-dependent flavin oxidoreductase [unclassified Paenibacillus]|uniref:NADH-dependent flavin oxidoreductase n=1 Tax=unclassified Paenibacillus TaxID=185978 RepID=UPI0003E26948|nr:MULTISPECIES: NADH-dependent flavin oxidoreductase [unclassified Paenibacillus]ETT54198.1 NADH-dependent flavin oxidoreductase [Paenibacillus sp. FSL R7-269]OMF85739.1 NADH-dependent flavin oxidoreductase [Paenibacillus sp. FSL R7-0337]